MATEPKIAIPDDLYGVPELDYETCKVALVDLIATVQSPENAAKIALAASSHQDRLRRAHKISQAENAAFALGLEKYGFKTPAKAAKGVRQIMWRPPPNRT